MLQHAARVPHWQWWYGWLQTARKQWRGATAARQWQPAAHTEVRAQCSISIAMLVKPWVIVHPLGDTSCAGWKFMRCVIWLMHVVIVHARGDSSCAGTSIVHALCDRLTVHALSYGLGVQAELSVSLKQSTTLQRNTGYTVYLLKFDACTQRCVIHVHLHVHVHVCTCILNAVKFPGLPVVWYHGYTMPQAHYTLNYVNACLVNAALKAPS